MSRPLTLYSYVPSSYSASYEYRVFVPLRTARDLGLPIRAHIDTNLAGITSEERVKAFAEADVILLYQPIGDHVLHNARSAKGILPSKVEGEWKYPPSLVIDTDDNLFNVNPHNNAFRTLGIRDHEGRPIPPGHTIGEVRNGERRILWQDGQDGFDISRNRHNLDTYKHLLELSDLVSVTTPRVKEYVQNESVPRRVEVFPNLVRMVDYPQVKLAPDPSRINILWQGGASHYEDWYPLREVMGNLTRKYPEIHWTIWGQLYHWVTELIPPDRYTFTSWCDYREYKLRLCMVGHDINLAPLYDNRFNRCRSAIKFYESSVLEKPAATLAQATGPYADEILDGQTGLLFSDPEGFEAQLSTLIENAGLRQSLAANAKDWVNQERDAFKHVPRWVQTLESLREAAKIEQPHMPDDEWERFVESQQVEAEEPVVAGA